MLRTLMRAKIHRATVTHADLHYVGSCTISSDLMEAADLVEGEQIDIVDVDNGHRLTTYVIAGPAGEGRIGINGAAAHLVGVGDTVILSAYGMFGPDEVATHEPVSCSSTATTVSSNAAPTPPTRPRAPVSSTRATAEAPAAGAQARR